jgi:hypothetical protein
VDFIVSVPLPGPLFGTATIRGGGGREQPVIR